MNNRADVQKFILNEIQREFREMSERRDLFLGEKYTSEELMANLEDVTDAYIANQIRSAIHYAKLGATSGAAYYYCRLQDELVKSGNISTMINGGLSDEKIMSTLAQKYGVRRRIPTDEEMKELENKMVEVAGDEKKWFPLAKTYHTYKYLRGDVIDKELGFHSNQIFYKNYIGVIDSQVQYKIDSQGMDESYRETLEINMDNVDNIHMGRLR